MSVDGPDKPESCFDSMGVPGAYESMCEALIPSAPVNTPQIVEATSDVATAARKPSGKIEKEPVVSEFKTEVASGALANYFK